MASLGVQRFVIGRVLNHVERGVTRVYDRHSYDDDKRRALERWDELLRRMLRGESAQVVQLHDESFRTATATR